MVSQRSFNSRQKLGEFYLGHGVANTAAESGLANVLGLPSVRQLVKSTAFRGRQTRTCLAESNNFSPLAFRQQYPVENLADSSTFTILGCNFSPARLMLR